MDDKRRLAAAAWALAHAQDHLPSGEKGPVQTLSRVRRQRRLGVGRNEPCLCGSGRKFKKCCMRR